MSLSHSALFVVLVLLLSGPVWAVARHSNRLSRSAELVAAPPAPPAFAVQNYTWSNCNALLPVQLDDVTQIIVQGDVLFLLVRFHTAVAIDSAFVIDNVTATPPSGGPSTSSTQALGLQPFLLAPTSLPIAAGSTNLLLSVTEQNTLPVAHFDERVQWYDAYQNVIGCTLAQYDVVQL